MLSSLEDSLKFIGDQKDLMYRWGIKLLTTYHQKTKEEVQTIYKRDQLDKLFIDSLKLLTAFTTNILLEEVFF